MKKQQKKLSPRTVFVFRSDVKLHPGTTDPTNITIILTKTGLI